MKNHLFKVSKDTLGLYEIANLCTEKTWHSGLVDFSWFTPVHFAQTNQSLFAVDVGQHEYRVLLLGGFGLEKQLLSLLLL